MDKGIAIGNFQFYNIFRRSPDAAAFMKFSTDFHKSDLKYNEIGKGKS